MPGREIFAFNTARFIALVCNMLNIPGLSVRLNFMNMPKIGTYMARVRLNFAKVTSIFQGGTITFWDGALPITYDAQYEK